MQREIRHTLLNLIEVFLKKLIMYFEQFPKFEASFIRIVVNYLPYLLFDIRKVNIKTVIHGETNEIFNLLSDNYDVLFDRYGPPSEPLRVTNDRATFYYSTRNIKIVAAVDCPYVVKAINFSGILDIHFPEIRRNPNKYIIEKLLARKRIPCVSNTNDFAVRRYIQQIRFHHRREISSNTNSIMVKHLIKNNIMNTACFSKNDNDFAVDYCLSRGIRSAENSNARMSRVVINLIESGKMSAVKYAKQLSRNSSDVAIEFMSRFPILIDWEEMSANKNLFARDSRLSKWVEKLSICYKK